MIQPRILLCAAVGLALGLTACSTSNGTKDSGDSGNSSPSEIKGTLTGIFDTQYKAALDPIVTDFKAKYPKVDVKINYQGGDLGSVILTQFQAGTAPDVILAFPGGDPASASDNVAPLAKSGRIASFTADWQSQIPDVWKSSVEYDNKLYAFPGALQPLAAMYNQTLLDEKGLKVPTTLDEVYSLCTAAKAKGVYAYAQGLGDTSAGPQMLSFGQTASTIYGANPTWDAGLATGAVKYAGSGWQTQFEIYKKMNDLGCFGNGALGRSRTQGQEAVSKRQALGLVDVGAVLAGIQQADPNDKFIVAPIPATNDGKNSISALPGYVLVVNSKAKNIDAARAFVAFAGEPAESAKYATGFGSVPLVPNTQFQAPDNLKGFADLVNAGKIAPLANLKPEVQTTLNTAVQSMLLGNLSPAQAAGKLDQAYGR
jgi:raffinose/stachyose/melibiose transport system substrate-binding protein